MVKLTPAHEMIELAAGPSKFIEAVSTGWSAMLSSLKSLPETGQSLEATRRWPEGV